MTSKVSDKFLPYQPQLDSLRAIAVGLVLIHHWMPENHWINRNSYNGVIGVTLFFVLSGFLITTILFHLKERQGKGELNGRGAIQNFWARRALRIFPLYYLTLLLLFLLNIGAIREIILWHLSYLYNFVIPYTETNRTYVHFWTLCVEQQFYTFWPFVILKLRKQYLPIVLFLFILSGPMSRYMLYQKFGLHVNWLTPCSFDALGSGALLAYCRYAGIPYRGKAMIGGLMVLCLLIIISLSFSEGINKHVPFYFGITLFAFFIVDLLSDQKPKFPVWLLKGPFPFLGKLSYSMYLFHNFILVAWLKFSESAQFSLSFFQNFLVSFFLLVFLSSLSFYFIEKPILKLKSRFK